MLSLFRFELQKLLRYRTAVGVLGFYMALFFLFMLATGRLHAAGSSLADAYAFPTLWTRLAATESGCTLLLVVLFSILVADDFQYRTFRQQFMDGATHGQLIMGKLSDSVLLAGFAMMTLLGVGMGLGFWYAARTWAFAPAQLVPVLLAGIQALGLLALAGLLTIALRKSAVSLLVFVLYLFIGEPQLRQQLPAAVARWMPCRVFFDLTPAPGQPPLAGPTPLQLAIVALLYVGLFWSLSYLLLRKRDL